MPPDHDQKPPLTNVDRRYDERHHDRLIEYVKHLTTLSTGSIVLQVAFLEKLLPSPKWRALVVISPISLAVSVIASVAAYTMLMSEPEELSEQEKMRFAMLVGVIWAGFLVGITALAVFGIKNVLAL